MSRRSTRQIVGVAGGRGPRTVDGLARLLLVLALLFGLAACGDDDSDEEIFTGVDGEDAPVVDDVPDDDEVGLDDPAGADDELIGAIEAYARTQIEGDPDELVQARSQGCAEVETDLDVGSVDPGDGLDEDIAVSDLEAEVENDEATVSYRLDPGGDQVTDERWVREDGEWKWDNC